MSKATFVGAGCNGPSLQAAIRKSLYSPSKDTLPAGATWPFVKLSVDERSVNFSMAHIQRSVTPSDGARISLTKWGYVFFHTGNEAKDFGFATLKIRRLMQELEKQGYHLDGSWHRNILIAKVSLVLQVTIPVAFLIISVVMGILKTNGV